MRHPTHQAMRLRPARDVDRQRTVCIVDPRVGEYADWHAASGENGVGVRVLASAEEALRVARSTTIDLWVINADLPVISGFELCQMLRNQTPATAVWIVADEYSAEVERRALASRATMFVCRETLKPAIEPALRSLATRGSMRRVKPTSA